MPNLYNESTKSGVNELFRVGNYSLVEWFKHDGYEPEYVLVSNFQSDEKTGTCEWDHGSYTIDFLSGKRLFRDKIFELEDLHDFQLDTDFNIWVNGRINAPLGGNARRIMEFPYFYELMDLCGINFINKNEYIGNLSRNPILRFYTDTAGQEVLVGLKDVQSVDDFIEKFNWYAIEYDVDLDVKMYLDAKENGFDGVPEVGKLVEDCEEVKKKLMDFANDLIRWRNLDTQDGLHNEYRKADSFNTITIGAFNSLDDRNRYIKDNKDSILKDLPKVNSRVTKSTVAMAEAKAEAKDISNSQKSKNINNDNLAR